MAKVSSKQIDIDEKKVIEQIQKNAKESIDKIAEKCGFSRQKVWRIIKRLEKNKTVWGYHAVIDNEKIGLKSYILLLKRSNVAVDKSLDKLILDTSEEIGKKIGINVLGSYYLHGTFDWIFCFTAEDIKHAKKFGEIINRDYSKYVSEIQIMEKIFTAKKCGSINPNINKLKDFF